MPEARGHGLLHFESAPAPDPRDFTNPLCFRKEAGGTACRVVATMCLASWSTLAHQLWNRLDLIIALGRRLGVEAIVLSATRAAVKVWERVGLRRCATKDSSKPTRLGMLYQASLGFHSRVRTILKPQTRDASNDEGFIRLDERRV